MLLVYDIPYTFKHPDSNTLKRPQFGRLELELCPPCDSGDMLCIWLNPAARALALDVLSSCSAIRSRNVEVQKLPESMPEASL